MRIAISAESTIDLPKELLTEFDIHTLPFTMILGDKNYLDGEISPEEMFQFTNKTGKLPKTSAVNEFQFEEHFDKLKEEGYDAIIHFSLSSALSSAYKNACRVAARKENIFVIDTKSLSTGIALQAIYARRLAQKGFDVSVIYEKCLTRILSDQASFVLESVKFLYKGGRCSMLSMLGANLLQIKPEIIVKTDSGKMVSGRKYRGKFDKVVMDYVEGVLSTFKTPDKEFVFITYSTAPDEVVEKVKERLQQEGFRHIYPTRAGGTISSHCGPNCLGILYINDGEHPL